MSPEKRKQQKDAGRQLFAGVDFGNDSSAFASQTSTFGRKSSSGVPRVSCKISQTSTFAEIDVSDSIFLAM
jgi:hypothetical protein